MPISKVQGGRHRGNHQHRQRKRRHNPGFSSIPKVNVGNGRAAPIAAPLSANYNRGDTISQQIPQRSKVTSRPRFSDESRAPTSIAASNTFVATKLEDIAERMRPLTRLAQFGADYNVDKDDKIGATIDYNLRTFHRTSTTTDATLAADGTTAGEYERLRSDPEWQKTLDFGTTYQHRFSGEGEEVSIEAKRERHWEQEDNQYTDVYELPTAPTSYDSTLTKPTETSTDLSADYSKPMGSAKLEAGYSGEFEKDDMNFLGQFLDPSDGELGRRRDGDEPISSIATRSRQSMPPMAAPRGTILIRRGAEARGDHD